MLSLDSIGIEHNLKQSSLKDDYLSLYDYEISRRFKDSFDLLIITNEKIQDVASVYSQRYPQSKIKLVTYGKENIALSSFPNVRHFHFFNIEELLSCEEIMSFDVIVEHSSNRKSHKIQLFKNLFLRLSNGGLYFIEELHAKFIQSLTDCEGPDILDIINEISQLKISNIERKNSADAYTLAIADCCESILIRGKLGVLIKNKLTLRGLRNNQAKELIESGILNGRIITINNNPYEYSHEISSTVNLSGNAWRNPKKFKIPQSFLVQYNNVNCEIGQVAYKDGYLLPDSFRMQYHKKIANRHITPLIDDLFLLKNKKYELTHLKGDYFYLDSEFPCHFGHFTSEVISRLWAWNDVKKLSPDVKVLIGLEKGRTLPSFVESILLGYGIGKEDIITFNDKIKVDTLYSATPYYVIGNHINPAIKDIWNKIGNSTNEGISGIKGKRLFIARPESGGRKCLNSDRLEKIFKDRGFEFYSPEKHSWKDQVKTFSNVNVIAGYAGSGTFNTMFASGNNKKLVIIGSNSYTAINEHYICASKGFDLTYFLGDSLLAHDNGWSAEAFMSDYNFNYERDEKALIEYLDSILEHSA